IYIRNRSQSICMQHNTVSLVRLYLIRNIRKLLYLRCILIIILLLFGNIINNLCIINCYSVGLNNTCTNYHLNII
ncbi:hypothetical protein ALC53_12087, partial [Atta colombica]